MKYNLKTGEIEGTPEEIANYVTAEKEKAKPTAIQTHKEGVAPQPSLMAHRQWTISEENKLTDLREVQRMNFESIGKIMGRSAPSVRIHHNRMVRKQKTAIVKRGKFTPEIHAYLEKAYPSEEKSMITKMLESNYGLKIKWSGVRDYCSDKGIHRKRGRWVQPTKKQVAASKAPATMKKFGRKKKFNAGVMAYLQKAYPADHQDEILRTLEQAFQIKTNWLSVTNIAHRHDIKRDQKQVRTEVARKDRDEINRKPESYLPVQKMCKNCAALFRRPERITNYQWKKRLFCEKCYLIHMGKMQSAKKGRRYEAPDAFPRFSSTLASPQDLKDLFYDTIANKKIIGKDVWFKLQIRDSDAWLNFCKEAMKLKSQISSYYSSPDLFKLEKSDTDELLRLSYGR